MIIELFLNVYSMIIIMFTKILPSWSLPEIIPTSIQWAYDFIFQWEGILPIYYWTLAFSAVVVFEGAVLTFKFISGMLSILRGGGDMKI